MIVHGLPGKDPATEEWLSGLLSSLGGQHAQSVQTYRCWGTPGTELDLQAELGKLSQVEADLVVAKSIGTRVCIHGFAQGIRADRYVLIGVPVRSLPESEHRLLNELCDRVPTLLIQNRDDPVGGSEQLKALLQDHESMTLAETPGNDHWYGETELLKDVIESWLKRGQNAINSD